MKSLKISLWVTGLGCLAAVPFIFIPWSYIGIITSWFNIEPLPNAPIVIYFYKTVFAVFGLIGIFFIILALDPFGYGIMLDLGAYGLMLFGVLTLILGLTLTIPIIVYLGDSLSGLFLGIIIKILSSKQRQNQQ
jgi:asparagine N-glycosylation enzyme membrane subunit Stt3